MSFPIRAACVLVLCLLTACNHSSSRSATNAYANRSNDVTPASAALMQALYDDADAAREQGEAALQTLRTGDASAAAQGLAQARSRLSASAERCGGMPGCAVERVAKAQDALLASQSRALLGGVVARFNTLS